MDKNITVAVLAVLFVVTVIVDTVKKRKNVAKHDEK